MSEKRNQGLIKTTLQEAGYIYTRYVKRDVCC